MTEAAWARLMQTPGAQARHQAVEILKRPLDEFEARRPECLAMRRWAVAVVSGEFSPYSGAASSDTDLRAAKLEAIAWIVRAEPRSA